MVMKEKILVEKIKYDQERFFQTYVQLTANQEQHVLLESGRTGRYSIAGIKPFATIKANEQQVEIEQDGERTVRKGKPLNVLEKWMKQFYFQPKPGLPDFQGGAIGYISYDYVHLIEDLPRFANDDLQFPLLHFLIFDEWAVFDHEEQCLWLMILNGEGAKEKLQLAKKAWLDQREKQISKKETPKATTVPDISFTEEEFVAAVEKVQDYIANGEVFQVNLTVRQSKKLDIPPLLIYEKLREINPSPYMGYLHTPEGQIISGSPEMFIKKSGNVVSTRPIGGTRSRGKNEVEDAQLADELITNEKERAEHIMLVDVERNDFGKVCEYGSVKVDELMVLEKYSHVMHIVSHLHGQLAKNKSVYDLIEAAFPGGTITGAPKIRTLEIIEQLEPVKRGVYTGTLGWIGFNGDAHLNVIIRTMLVQEGVCHVQAGAGIVIDSNPVAEYKESLKKAAALWKAKEVAELEVCQ